MQLVRSLYISSERTYTRKIREAKLAEELEDEHSKEWILEKYLDSIPYGTVGGQSAIGIKAAARIYFSKDLKDLNAARGGAARRPAAGAVATTRRRAAAGAAKARRNEVLRKMAELGDDHAGAGRSAMRRKPRPRALDVLLQAAARSTSSTTSRTSCSASTARRPCARAG